MHFLLVYVTVPLASGVLTGIPLLQNGAAPLAYIAMIPYFAVLIRCAGRDGVGQTLLCSFLFGFAYELTAFGWISQMHPLYFTGMSGFASFAICYGGSVLLSALFALPIILFGFLLRTACRSEVVIRHRLLLVPVAASLWALLEAAGEIGTFAVPWARLAAGQAGYPLLIGSARLFGGVFVGAVAVAVNIALTLALTGRDTRKSIISASTGAAALLLSVLLPLIPAFSSSETGETADVAVIQGNIPTNEKWEDPSISVDTYIALLETLDGDAPDIVLMPETAVTFDITASPNKLQRIKAFAYKNECTVLFGTYTFDAEGRCFNTVREVENGALTGDYYAKRKLVPFGEYLPFYDFFKEYLPDISRLELFSEQISAGDSPCVFDAAGAKIGALICFDSLFPSLSRGSVKAGANVMFIATNDGWFSETYAVNIHNSIAKVRAVEVGRYYIRAANTGISSVISPDGTANAIIPANERGIIRYSVPTVSGDTLYTKSGNAFVFVCLGFAAAFYASTAVGRILSKRKREKR